MGCSCSSDILPPECSPVLLPDLWADPSQEHSKGAATWIRSGTAPVVVIAHVMDATCIVLLLPHQARLPVSDRTVAVVDEARRGARVRRALAAGAAQAGQGVGEIRSRIASGAVRLARASSCWPAFSSATTGRNSLYLSRAQPSIVQPNFIDRRNRITRSPIP